MSLSPGGSALTLSIQGRAVSLYRQKTFSNIIFEDCKAGKDLYVEPLTAAMLQYLEGQIESACSTAESDLLAHALLSVPLWKHECFRPGCGLSKDACFTLQLRLLNRQKALLQEVHNQQLAQQLNQNMTHQQELQQQLEQKQGLLDNANQTIARLRAQRQRHREQLDATRVQVQQNSLQEQIALGAATAQAQAERNISAQLRTELEAIRALLQEEQHESGALRVAANQASASLDAERRQKAEVQAAADDLTAQLLAEQQLSTELRGQLEAANADGVARQRQTTQFQALVVSLRTQLEAEQRQRAEFQSQMESQVQQLQVQLRSVQDELQLASSASIESAKAQLKAANSSAALADTAQEALVLKPQAEQVRRECSQGQGEATQAAASGADATQVHFESNGKLSKAAALPGEKPAPNVGGLKLKPGLGMRQIDGAASNSPTTPTSPLILAKNPFAEISRSTQMQRQSLLGSPLGVSLGSHEAAGKSSQQKEAKPAVNAADIATHCEEVDVKLDSIKQVDIRHSAAHQAAEPPQSLRDQPRTVSPDVGTGNSLATHTCSDSRHALQPAASMLMMRKKFRRPAQPMMPRIQAQANGPVSGRPPKSAGSSSSKDHQHISHAAAQQAAEPSSSPDAQPGSSSRAHVLPVGNSSSSVFQGNASSMVNSQVESVGLISSAFTQGPPISHAAAHQAAKPSQSLEGWPSSLVSTANVGSDADGASDSDQAATLHAVEPVVRQDDQSGTTTTAEVTMEAFHRLKASQGSKASPGLMTSPDSRQPAGKQHGMKKRFKPLPVQDGVIRGQNRLPGPVGDGSGKEASQAGQSKSLAMAKPQVKEETAPVKRPAAVVVSDAAPLTKQVGQCRRRDTLEQLRRAGFEPFHGTDYWWRCKPDERLLGEGASGKVHRGVKVLADGTVVHVAAKQLIGAPYVKSAEREAAILNEVSGRWYTVPFYDMFKDEAANPNADPQQSHASHTAWLITGLAEGQDLKSFCKRVHDKAASLAAAGQVYELNALMQWTWQFSLHVFFLLAQALRDVHRTRSHRDLKLANVMVSGWDRDGGVQIKLIDWGSSRRHEELELNRQCTLPMASPQLLPYLHPDKKMVYMDDVSNDAWAAGCFLHEMITCATPDWGETFFPVDAVVQAQQLPEAERMAAIVPAMQGEHRKLADMMRAFAVTGCLPDQIVAVQQAANFASPDHAWTHVRQVATLIMNLLTEDPKQRYRAETVCQEQWLTEGVTSPLIRCPIAI